MWQKDYTDVINNFKMGRWSWIIHVDPKCNHKKNMEENVIQTEEKKALW